MAGGYLVSAVMAVAFTGGALLLLPALVTHGLGWLASGRGALAAVHLGVVTTAGAYLLFGRGLSRIPVTVAATISLAEPLTASLLGAFLFGERLSATRWGGALLLLAALALVAAPTRLRLPRGGQDRMAKEGRLSQHVA